MDLLKQSSTNAKFDSSLRAVVGIFCIGMVFMPGGLLSFNTVLNSRGGGTLGHLYIKDLRIRTTKVRGLNYVLPLSFLPSSISLSLCYSTLQRTFAEAVRHKLALAPL